LFERLTRSGLVLGAWAVFHLARAGSAHACSCTHTGLAVYPRPGEIAPRNTHIWVEVPADLADASPTLRATGIGAVPADVRRLGASSLRTIELIPRTPLPAHVLVEVLLGSDVVGEVRVGEATDDKPPTWDGLESGEASAGRFEGCGAGQPFVELSLGKRGDDQTPARALRYAVWLGQPGQALPYGQPPALVVSAWGDRLSLGHESRCAAANLELPPAFAVGVRVMDLAGNLGPASEADIRVPRPATATTPPPTRTQAQR
jgi:hypothetical protein